MLNDLEYENQKFKSELMDLNNQIIELEKILIEIENNAKSFVSIKKEIDMSKAICFSQWKSDNSIRLDKILKRSKEIDDLFQLMN